MKRFLVISLVLVPFLLSAQKNCTVDDFTGTDRKMAKTTFAHANKTETFKDLPGLIMTLPDDKSMTTRKPPISNNPYFLRIAEEDRNVKIMEAYIFIITRQKDNDFLLTIGSDPDYTKAVFFLAGVSGLPDPSRDSFNTLNAVRAKLKNQFGNVCGKPVLLLDNPVKIIISGSLFFDINRKPGKSVHKKIRTTTAWEIHPVSEIVFN
jgi:hypothetical protein